MTPLPGKYSSLTYHKFTLMFSNPLLKRSVAVILLTFSFLLGYSHSDGHKIKGMISNYYGSEVFLAMLYGGHQYAVDTAIVENGSFVFDSRYDLQSGVYLVILPPATSFLILIDQNEHEFSFTGEVANINNTIAFNGSPDNTEYYKYLNFFESKKKYLDTLKIDYEAKKEEQDKLALYSKMQQLKKEIIAYQSELVSRLPGTLTAAMVKCELTSELPAFDGSPEEINFKKFQYQREHFFDNTDLADERLIRAPKNVIVDRVDYYLDYLTPQHPDSIINSVDLILAKTAKSDVTYRFFLTHIFNRYREAKSIGMDAIYVHIAENYIAKGKAPWIEGDEKNTILSAVKLVSPTLIGKTAPDFIVQKQDGNDISLHSIQSPYTVLFFWAPNCTHCQQSIPVLSKFYNAYKEKGVQVFAVCTKLNEQEKNCWDYVDKNQLHGWINASDKMGGSSTIHSQYNLKTTPRVFVLDRNKTIIAKDLGVEHLEEVMKRLLATPVK